MKTKGGFVKDERPDAKSDNYYAAQGKRPGVAGEIRGAEYSNRHAGAHALKQSVGVIISGTHKACK